MYAWKVCSGSWRALTHSQVLLKTPRSHFRAKSMLLRDPGITAGGTAERCVGSVACSSLFFRMISFVSVSRQLAQETAMAQAAQRPASISPSDPSLSLGAVSLPNEDASVSLIPCELAARTPILRVRLEGRKQPDGPIVLTLRLLDVGTTDLLHELFLFLRNELCK